MLIKQQYGEDIYYDKNNIVKCPECNTLIFYINNSFSHKCLIKNNTIEINEFNIKEKNSKFICDVNKIQDKWHNNEFLYYKDSIYFCRKCAKEKNLNDNFLILDQISLSTEEINEFKYLINDYEKILLKIKELNEELINELKTSYERFEKKNKLLIEYCKSLIKFNDKYDNNYNLISTIRRISINFNINQFKNLINKDLIYFYDDNYIINFNNKYDLYFKSENILQKGKYYLGESINKSKFREVFKALSIKNKKIVIIKKVNLSDEDYINEINILKIMNECEYSVKFIDSLKKIILIL